MPRCSGRGYPNGPPQAKIRVANRVAPLVLYTVRTDLLGIWAPMNGQKILCEWKGNFPSAGFEAPSAWAWQNLSDPISMWMQIQRHNVIHTTFWLEYRIGANHWAKFEAFFDYFEDWPDEFDCDFLSQSAPIVSTVIVAKIRIARYSDLPANFCTV